MKRNLTITASADLSSALGGLKNLHGHLKAIESARVSIKVNANTSEALAGVKKLKTGIGTIGASAKSGFDVVKKEASESATVIKSNIGGALKVARAGVRGLGRGFAKAKVLVKQFGVYLKKALDPLALILGALRLIVGATATVIRTTRRLAIEYAKINVKILLGGLKLIGTSALSVLKTFKNIALVGAVAFAGIALGATKVAGEYDKSRLRLTTLVGDAKKANDIFQETVEFANRTPFETKELVDARILLTSFGQTSIEALEAVGDASAVADRGINDIVAVIAGLESEPLRRLGITMKNELLEKNRATFTFLNKMGEETKIVANSFNEARQAVIGIFQVRFGGSLDALSKSVPGLISTIRGKLGDTLARFGSQFQDQMKIALGYVINLLDRIKGSKLLLYVGQEFGKAIERAVKFFESNEAKVGKFIVEAVVRMGGVANVLKEAFLAGKRVFEAKGLVAFIPVLSEAISGAFAIGVTYFIQGIRLIGTVFAGIGKIFANAVINEMAKQPLFKNLGLKGQSSFNQYQSAVKDSSSRGEFIELFRSNLQATGKGGLNRELDSVAKNYFGGGAEAFFNENVGKALASGNNDELVRVLEEGFRQKLYREGYTTGGRDPKNRTTYTGTDLANNPALLNSSATLEAVKLADKLSSQSLDVDFRESFVSGNILSGSIKSITAGAKDFGTAMSEQGKETSRKLVESFANITGFDMEGAWEDGTDRVRSAIMNVAEAIAEMEAPVKSASQITKDAYTEQAKAVLDAYKDRKVTAKEAVTEARGVTYGDISGPTLGSGGMRGLGGVKDVGETPEEKRLLEMTAKIEEQLKVMREAEEREKRIGDLRARVMGLQAEYYLRMNGEKVDNIIPIIPRV